MKNIIGIFGLICSGKSSFSKLLAKELNALYIDADIIGHEALNDKIKKEELIKEFSSDILDNNGNIDRKKSLKWEEKNKKQMKFRNKTCFSRILWVKYVFYKTNPLVHKKHAISSHTF